MCTIGCVNLDNIYLFKNRDPIRGTPPREWVEKYSYEAIEMLVIRNDKGCYGGLNQYHVGIVGTFVNIAKEQVNYFDGDNLIYVLQQGNIQNIYNYLLSNPLNLFGNILCSDGTLTYSFELNGSEVDCLQIKESYVMTNHFQRINKQILTIDDFFIKRWTYARLERGKFLISSISSFEDIKQMLSDHYEYPDYSICNHGKIPTASSYIIDCSHKKIYYCRGCPCENIYIEYNL